MAGPWIITWLHYQKYFPPPTDLSLCVELLYLKTSKEFCLYLSSQIWSPLQVEIELLELISPFIINTNTQYLHRDPLCPNTIISTSAQLPLPLRHQSDNHKTSTALLAPANNLDRVCPPATESCQHFYLLSHKVIWEIIRSFIFICLPLRCYELVDHVAIIYIVLGVRPDHHDWVDPHHGVHAGTS